MRIRMRSCSFLFNITKVPDIKFRYKVKSANTKSALIQKAKNVKEEICAYTTTYVVCVGYAYLFVNLFID